MVLTRRDASVAEHVAAVEAASFVYLAGDSPLHLRSALKDTPVWAAIVAAADRGVVAASGASAAGICDPMTDPRGGAFGLGLGLVQPLAVLQESETWSFDRLHRARQLSTGFPVVTLPSGTALVRTNGRWDRFGSGVEVSGELPA
jgi:cyanophycinase